MTVNLPLVEKLSLLAKANKDALTPVLDETGDAYGWWRVGRCWRRIYGRVEHQQQSSITLIYESIAPSQAQTLCVVEIFDQQPSSQGKAQATVQKSQLGWLRLTCFPADPALPTLAAVMEENADAWVVRYRPGRRCTLRVGQPDNSDELRFAKVFPDQRGALVHRDGQQLAVAAANGELSFRVAPPRVWDSNKLTLWQGCVPGEPVLAMLYGPAGKHLAERMGQAAASLPRSSLRTEAVFDGRAQLQRSARYAKHLTRMVPTLTHRVKQLITILLIITDSVDLHKINHLEVASDYDSILSASKNQ